MKYQKSSFYELRHQAFQLFMSALLCCVLAACSGGNANVTDPSLTERNNPPLTGGDAQPPAPVDPTNPQEPSTPNPPTAGPQQPPRPASETVCVENRQAYPTLKDPYAFLFEGYFLIYTEDQFIAMANDKSAWDKSFRLMSNLDFRDYYLDDGKHFSVGNKRKAFRGVFDGSGCEISGFTFSRKSRPTVLGVFGWKRYDSGLFVKLKKATVRNLKLDLVSSFGKKTGALAAVIENSTIENIQIKDGTVDGTKKSGIVAGKISSSEIRNIAVVDSYAKSKKFLGGLAGEIRKSIIERVSLTGVDLEGEKFIGGLAGLFKKSEAYEVMSSVIIKTRIKSGGLVGKSVRSRLESVAVSSLMRGRSDISFFNGQKRKSKLEDAYFVSDIDCSNCNSEGANENQNVSDWWKPAAKVYENWKTDSWQFSGSDLPIVKFPAVRPPQKASRI